MSGPQQTNVANAVTLRRRSRAEQVSHLHSCEGCLGASPPTLGEILDYCPRTDQRCKLRTHFVVFLGGSSLDAKYMCCVVCPVQWLKISATDTNEYRSQENLPSFPGISQNVTIFPSSVGTSPEVTRTCMSPSSQQRHSINGSG